MLVELIYCAAARDCHVEQHEVPAGCSLAQLLERTDWFERFAQTRGLSMGVYGQQVSAEYQLKQFDRVEFYRPLPQDPMKQRKARALKNKALKKQSPKQPAASKKSQITPNQHPE